MTKLYISVPCFGGLQQAQNAKCLVDLTHALRDAGVSYVLDHELHESLVQRARNSLTHRFLKSDCTHQLFIDADIVFHPRDVMGLLGADKPVVCGAYPRKAIIKENVVAAVRRGERDPFAHAASFVVNVQRPNDDVNEVTLHAEDMCVPVLDAATGFLLVQRGVYEEMIAAHPEWMYISDASANRGEAMHAVWDCAIVDGRYLSEDFLFSRRWQRLGGTVWLFLPARLGHIGSYTYEGNLFQTFVPQDAPRSPASEYSLPEENDPKTAAYMRERYEWAAARIEGNAVADACCGPGYGMPLLRGAMPGRYVHGFDRAKENARTASMNDFGPVKVCDVAGEAFGGFDAVVSIETIEHLPDPIGWMRGFAPSVKELVVSCPCIPTKHVNEHHLWDFTYEEVLGIVSGMGWTVKKHAMQNDDTIMVYAVRE